MPLIFNKAFDQFLLILIKKNGCTELHINIYLNRK